MWGTSRRTSAPKMPTFTTQARRSGQGGITGSAKVKIGMLMPSASTTNIAGMGLWDGPIEIDQASATWGSTGTRSWWQQNSDDDSADDAVVYSSNAHPFNIANLPMMRLKFSVNSIAAIRMWHGFFNAAGTAVVAADALADCTGIRFNTGAGDSTFKYVQSANSSETVTDSGITAAADTVYHFEVEIEASGVRYRIEDANGAVLNEQTIAGNRPRSDIAMYMVHGLETLEAVAKSWRLYFQEVYAEF